MKTYKIAIIAAVFLLCGKTTFAQLDPLSAQYFNNRYLINPAFAGLENETRLNLAYRSQWSNVPGAPVAQNVTLDHGFKRVGIGINFINDKAGLTRQTRAVGTFAYHIPVGGNNNKLNFGVSLGMMNQRLSNSDIIGNVNDPEALRYNDRETYLDGDFGAAYTDNKFTLHAAFPNLKRFFDNDEERFADVPRFFTSASYKFMLGGGTDGVVLEPQVAFRAIKDFDNIWDAGAQVSFVDNQLLFSGMYHSTKNATFGVGMDFRKKYLVSGLYTSNTAALNGYTTGNFEVNLRIKF
jgi:type IX secretion system PorP/SprF family membrane protein